jgi:hypothetical protein
MTRAISRVILTAAVVCVTAVVARAQQTTTLTESKQFEILAVNGNELVVRLPEGTRELTVADDFRFNIDGQQMSVHQLKPGMKGTAAVTTRTTVTPVTVTEVKNGTVMKAFGSSIIVRTDEGYKSFTQGDVDKRGVKIWKDGKPAQISDFHENDRLSATIITSKPPKVLTEKQVQASLAAGAAPSRGAPAAAAPTAAAAPARPAPAGQAPAAPAATAGTTKTLPKTASSWPLLALASVMSIAMGLALTIRRRFVR